jgi:hypothetical protein
MPIVVFTAMVHVVFKIVTEVWEEYIVSVIRVKDEEGGYRFPENLVF